MPLPSSDQTWPPLDPRILGTLADHDAWYGADPDRLRDRYVNRGVRERPENRPIQYRDGVFGRIARWFWGAPIPPGEKATGLHVPLAGDIARTSSELLFSEPPQLIAAEGQQATQDALDNLVYGGLHAKLLEAGETCAALGGTYLRVVWDTSVADRPWIDSVAADCAVPEFRYARLRAVTFWSVVHRDGTTVWRHLERHEPGHIYHGLYQGTPGQLGKQVSLKANPTTADLLDDQPTGTQLLTAAYVPNMRPARAWRHVPDAAGWGQSDFAGIEPIFDALDETYSSWMRDIRFGKGRIIVPNSMLTSNGPGQGSYLDLERSVFTGLEMLPRPGDSGKPWDIAQFEIRVAEHRDTARELMEIAVRQAGYSGATFGLSDDGQAVTATEVKARQTRSLTTRGKKALYVAPEVSSISLAWLAVMAGPLFRVQGLDLSEAPRVEFPDGITESQQETATALQLFTAADAMSTQVKVQIIHPDWDDDQVQAEVTAIHGERQLGPLADPAAVGVGGHGLFPPAGDPTA